MTTAATDPAIRELPVHGLVLRYADWGGEGPPLVLVHGGRDHARSWDAVARALAADWRVIAPDLRGHGDSDWSPDGAYALPFLVDDLAALVATLGAAPVAIVGHSLGAVTALRFAGAFPERVAKLVAIEGIGLSGPGRRSDDLATRLRRYVELRARLAAKPPRRYPTIDAALERMRDVHPRLAADVARHLTAHGLRGDEGAGYAWKYDPMIRVSCPVGVDDDALRQLWGAIACPVWLVHGAESWAAHPDVDGRSAIFRDPRVTSYEGAGHWVQHDRAEAFVADLAAFLAG